MKIKYFIFFLLFSLVNTDAFAEDLPQDLGEKFDPALLRLDNIEKLNTYIDSVCVARNVQLNTKEELLVVNDIIENRFFHAYSHYSFTENPIAYLSGEFLWDHLSAVVIPDDLMKYPMAACSQQSIVMMEVLKMRGYSVRKLGLTGHFVLEVLLDGEWRMFDPNKEMLKQGIRHTNIRKYLDNGDLNRYYPNMDSVAVSMMFSSLDVGEADVFPAKNARIFHVATFYLSYILPLLLMIASIGYIYYLRRMKPETTFSTKRPFIKK